MKNADDVVNVEVGAAGDKITKEVLTSNTKKINDYVKRIMYNDLDSIAEGQLSNLGESTKNALRLALEGQAKEVGEVIAGVTHKAKFRNAMNYARAYGGDAADYVKKRSRSASVYRVQDTLNVETHWVENVKTGERFDIKIKTEIVKSENKS